MTSHSSTPSCSGWVYSQIFFQPSSSAFPLYPVDTSRNTFGRSSPSPVMEPKWIVFLHLDMCWSVGRDSPPSSPLFSVGFLSQDGDQNTNITHLLLDETRVTRIHLSYGHWGSRAAAPQHRWEGHCVNVHSENRWQFRLGVAWTVKFYVPSAKNCHYKYTKHTEVKLADLILLKQPFTSNVWCVLLKRHTTHTKQGRFDRLCGPNALTDIWLLICAFQMKHLCVFV